MDQQKNITDQQTQEAADLSLINLSPDELEMYTKNLNDLNELFHELQTLDTKEATSKNEHTMTIEHCREDEPNMKGLTNFSPTPNDIKQYIPTFNPENAQIEVPTVLDNDES